LPAVIVELTMLAMLRPTKLLILLPLLAGIAPVVAQPLGPPLPAPAVAPPTVKRSVEVLPSPDAAAPVRSTLKPAPVIADSTQPRQRMVTVFGTEPCPKPTSKDEVVVCARLPESEIYRIPKRLREAQNRVSPFQANRNLLLGDSSGGAGGAIGSCSVVGGSGIIGCTRKDIDNWAHDRANRAGATEEIPPQ
jgi:hypothetical protein